MRVTIVGGGVIGLCSAYYLQKDGHEVTVIDRGEITDGCSFGNMGYMSPSHFIPLASPGIISEGLRHMMSSSSPFYIKPRMNWDLLKWGWNFWKSCNTKTVQKNSPHLNAILQLSRHLMDDMRNEIGDSFSMEAKGCLMMCKTQSALDHEFHTADDAEKFGLKVERLTRAQVQELETDVEVDVAGAVLFRDDCHFHPGQFMTTLHRYLISKGVQFRLNTTISGFECSNNKITSATDGTGTFTADQFIICTGSWLPLNLKLIGMNLLLQAGKGYSYTYPFIEKNIKFPAILVDGRCAITPWQNKLRIGGTMEISGINNRILINRMKGIYNSAKDFYPGLKIDFPPIEKIWYGFRPVTPDGLPYIGRTRQFENLLVAGGHAMLGISEGTGTGKLVSEMINNHQTSIDTNAFRVERFGR